MLFQGFFGHRNQFTELSPYPKLVPSPTHQLSHGYTTGNQHVFLHLEQSLPIRNIRTQNKMRFFTVLCLSTTGLAIAATIPGPAVPTESPSAQQNNTVSDWWNPLDWFDTSNPVKQWEGVWCRMFDTCGN